jgi:hypothetical protein
MLLGGETKLKRQQGGRAHRRGRAHAEGAAGGGGRQCTRAAAHLAIRALRLEDKMEARQLDQPNREVVVGGLASDHRGGDGEWVGCHRG